MLVEVTKKETVEIGLPFYAKSGNSYFFIAANENILEVHHFLDGTVSVNTQSPGSIYHKTATENAIGAEIIEAEEFEVKFCDALTKIGHQLGLDPVTLRAV